MAKFVGRIGFVTSSSNSTGVWTETATEKQCYGDIIRSSRREDSNNTVNKSITVNNKISIVADAYINTNIFAIRYVYWMGAYWDVSEIEVQSPRLILSIGGAYNGPVAN